MAKLFMKCDSLLKAHEIEYPKVQITCQEAKIEGKRVAEAM